jgi:hypothetical protein
MTRQDYLLIARAINRAKKKKIPAKLMFFQIPMEIAWDILDQDKSFDYREFYRECNHICPLKVIEAVRSPNMASQDSGMKRSFEFAESRHAAEISLNGQAMVSLPCPELSVGREPTVIQQKNAGFLVSKLNVKLLVNSIC